MYQHGRRSKQSRAPGVFLATIAIVGIVVVAVWFIINKDIAKMTDPKTTVPILTEVSVKNSDVKKINEASFSIDLPSDWEFVEHRKENKINAYIYRGTAQGKDAKTLYIHVDVMPESYKIVKMQPLYPSENTIKLGNLSSDCSTFGNTKDNEPFEAKWENVNFMCDPIEANQTIGTGVGGRGIGAKIGSHTYFFYYEDHDIRPDSNIFRIMLQSFVGK